MFRVGKFGKKMSLTTLLLIGAARTVNATAVTEYVIGGTDRERTATRKLVTLTNWKRQNQKT